jgi:hypothetical protein
MGVARPPDNNFEIRGVPPGSYLLFAQMGNGPQAMIGTQPIDITSSHLDNLTLTLAPGADIQGSIKVVDSTAPVDLPNINVMLRASPMGMMGGPPRAKVADDKTFTLKNVPPVGFGVTVAGVPDTCYVKSIQYGGIEVGPNDTVEMANGARLEVTISAGAGSVDATIVNKDGQPDPGAMAVLVSKETGQNFVRANSVGDGGLVSFKGLKPGDYLLFAWDDVEPGAYQDPDFRKPFEGRAESVKISTGGSVKAQVKAIE